VVSRSAGRAGGSNPYGVGSDHSAGDDWDGAAGFWSDDMTSKPTVAPSRERATTPIQAALDKLIKSMPTATIDAKIGCTHCGHDHVRDGKRTCNAHSRRATPLRPCRLFPPQGLAVCRFHGGAAPQVAAKAERRVIEAQLLGAVNAAVASQPSPVLLPTPKPKTGGHKKTDSRSARRSRLRRETLRRDEQLPPEHPHDGGGRAE
jgi:hypothetical protein